MPMWRIQQVLSSKACHQTCLITSIGHGEPNVELPASPRRYWGKFLATGSNQSLLDNFHRQIELNHAIQVAGLIPLVEAIPASRVTRGGLSGPMLIYPFVRAQTLDDWLTTRAQLPSHTALLEIIHQTLKTVSAIHRIGMAHGQIDPSHILITDHDQSVRIVGLGCLEPIGAVTCLPRLTNVFDAPEVHCNEFEVSSATDIFSLGQIIIKLFGPTAASWPITKAMTAEHAIDRPTSAQLVSLFASLRQHESGWLYTIRSDQGGRAA